MGILSGKYSVHGGVIRNAAGQIVKHLVPAAAATNLNPFGLLSLPFDIINTFQLKGIAEATQQLLNLGHATMALSGLNLAVSAVGFAAMYASLDEVKSHLERMDRKLGWIKDFLETGRRAAILSAAEELSCLPEDPSHRSQILYTQRTSLGQTAMHYLEHWDQSDELLEAMAYQHFYCTTFLMKARCSAELGMFDKAISEIAMGRAAWQQIRARRERIVNSLFGHRILSVSYPLM
ncbi:hypothetical protein MEO93_28915 [Dolichospermum sp. ST_sed3]|nr:hypothetical protein [Dolichospermum sp. ST_sed3]